MTEPLLPEEVLESFNDKFFERDRTPPEVRAFGTYLYASMDSSFRKDARILKDISIHISHLTVWSWVQRVDERVGDEAFHKRKRKVLVVDETK